ncbi:MAG: hypothetical protein ACRBHB_17125 [Arenicella sp.]
MNNENKLTESQALKARDIESKITQLVGVEGHKTFYEPMGIDKDAFGRFYGNQIKVGLKQVSELIALMGYDLVPGGSEVVPPGSVAIPKAIAVAAWHNSKEGLVHMRRKLEKKGCVFND